ncbi:hypothetical protein TNCV_3347691 [Trichonephila clavipes]|nr:hypothetical protein TNCV_3347691 [Trichonephila clavipes]
MFMTETGGNTNIPLRPFRRTLPHVLFPRNVTATCSQHAKVISLREVYGCLVVKITSSRGWRVMSTTLVPLKTRRVEGRTMHVKLVDAFYWCDYGMLAQVSSSSLDCGSKLRGPSPKALE